MKFHFAELKNACLTTVLAELNTHVESVCEYFFNATNHGFFQSDVVEVPHFGDCYRFWLQSEHLPTTRSSDFCDFSRTAWPVGGIIAVLYWQRSPPPPNMTKNSTFFLECKIATCSLVPGKKAGAEHELWRPTSSIGRFFLSRIALAYCV